MNGPVPMVVALAKTRKGVRLEYWISKPYTFSSSRTTVGSRSRLFGGNYRSADQPVKLLSLICAYAIRRTSVD